MYLTKELEEQKRRIMENLKVDEQEALQILEYDKKVETTKKCEYDLDEELEKLAKKMANTGTKTVDAYGKTRIREKKVDEEKRGIIQTLQKAFNGNVENLQILNIERQISFTLNGNNYEITVTKKRKWGKALRSEGLPIYGRKNII